MHINTLQMVSFELFPHKFNLSAIFGLRNLHFCCCGVHGEFLNDDNVNYMAVVGFHAATFIQFLIEMTYHKVTRINTSLNMSCLETALSSGHLHLFNPHSKIDFQIRKRGIITWKTVLSMATPKFSDISTLSQTRGADYAHFTWFVSTKKIL